MNLDTGTFCFSLGVLIPGESLLLYASRLAVTLETRIARLRRGRGHCGGDLGSRSDLTLPIARRWVSARTSAD